MGRNRVLGAGRSLAPGKAFSSQMVTNRIRISSVRSLGEFTVCYDADLPTLGKFIFREMHGKPTVKLPCLGFRNVESSWDP